MDHYIDIRVHPDPELATAHVLNALAGKLHRVLAILKSEDIGISFPCFDAAPPSLGDTLRLHGTSARLQLVLAQNWLGGAAGHVTVSPPTPVPENTAFRVVRRVQSHSNADRIRRRQMKRHGWTETEAREKIPDTVEQKLKLPYLCLHSQSTGQPFRLFIEHLPLQPSRAEGSFNAYGLSTSATVPWF